MLIRSLSLFLLLSAASPALGQQAVMSNDYWLSFLPSLDNNAPIWVLVSTLTEGTKVKVVYSDDGVTADQFMVSPNSPKEYRIRMNTNGDPYPMAKPDSAEFIQRRSLHITSSSPISVQQFTNADNNVSLSLPIPTGYLGRSYVVMAFNDQPEGPNELADGSTVSGSVPRTSGQFLIVAAEDSTKIGIRLSGKTSSGRQAGDSFAVALRKGETYLVKGLADSATNDLTGTLIESNKPIAVLAGAEAMQALDKVGKPSYFFYNDHISEYLPPIEQWGNDYVTHPLSNKNGNSLDTPYGELIRVIANEPTTIVVNGTAQPMATRWDFPRTSEPLHIKSVKPVMVAQYDYYIHKPSSAIQPRSANSMQILTPRHQWVKHASFTLPTGYAQTYLYVTAHRDSIDKITVLLPGKSQPVSVAGLRFNLAPIENFGDYRTYTLLLNAKGQSRIQGPCQFQVLNHGTRDNDIVNATYGYASSLGSTFGRLKSFDFLVSVDSSCGKFTLTIQDTAAEGDGIADVTLLNGSHESGMYMSRNVTLSVDAHAIGSKLVTASVRVIDQSAASYAAVLVRTREGKEKVIVLSFTKLAIKLSPDSLTFWNVPYGTAACTTVTLQNTGTTPITLDSLSLLQDIPFALSSEATFPLILGIGQSFTFDVCFSPIDTGIIREGIARIMAGCQFANVLKVRGLSRVAIVFAEDQDFKIVNQNERRTESIRISNLSPYIPLRITGYEMAHSEFAIHSDDSARLPIELTPAGQPGSSTYIQIHYQPLNSGSDTAVVFWKTDIQPPFTDTNRKNWSTLAGRSIAASVTSNEDRYVIGTVGNMLTFELRVGELLRSIRITDILGRTWHFDGTGSIPLDEFVAGAYFIQVITSERRVSQKIVR